jgi:S1-C subfamily serine protease
MGICRPAIENQGWVWHIAAMKWLAGILGALLALPVLAADKVTALKVGGVSYTQIEDAHVAGDGRVVILYSGGGASLDADQLPKSFLDSWGITPAQITASKAAARRQAEQALAQAIDAGYFREADGVIYDLRKPQPKWLRMSGAKILQVLPDGALLDLSPNPANPEYIFLRNLPPGLSDHQVISVVAKVSGTVTFLDRSNDERTLRAYDLGHVCKRSQIPAAMLQEDLAQFALPDAPKTREHAIAAWPGQEHLRGIGSGFFVTRDGYLLTNHHVVKDAEKIEVKYRGNRFQAKVVEVDKDNDLAVLKVEGGHFQPLAISPAETADLGQEVFTIGFPNIQMQGVEPKYTDGKISSLYGMQDDPSEYQISVPVQPGNSGGPLCDSSGQVVGVVVARINDFAVLQNSGVMPQNVNYAVKARHVLRLLKKVKGLEPAQPAMARPANPIKNVQDAIVMVMVY